MNLAKIIFSVAAVMLATVPAAATDTGADADEYVLVFSDEFDGPDGSQPSADKWIRCPRQSSTWNRWLSDSEEVIYIEDGQLVARAIPNPDQQADPAHSPELLFLSAAGDDYAEKLRRRAAAL